MLWQRVLTAVVLAPLVLAAIVWLPPAWFALFLQLFLVLGAWEWSRLAGMTAWPQRAGYVGILIGCSMLTLLLDDVLVPVLVVGGLWWLAATVLVVLHPRTAALSAAPGVPALAGVLVLVPAVAGLTWLKALPLGPWLVVYVLLVVWAADIGAYFSGHAFGRRKLAPAVSPGKTWEGAIGGALAALLLAGGLALAVPGFAERIGGPAAALLLTVGLTAISVVGDLTESLFKRQSGVKDSGGLLPGHGGILDRIDSVLAAAPLLALWLALAAEAGGARLMGAAP